jgi:hypothetical protein
MAPPADWSWHPLSATTWVAWPPIAMATRLDGSTASAAKRAIERLNVTGIPMFPPTDFVGASHTGGPARSFGENRMKVPLSEA